VIGGAGDQDLEVRGTDGPGAVTKRLSGIKQPQMHAYRSEVTDHQLDRRGPTF